MKQIKEMMKAQGLNLGQNDTGFNRRFKDKATTMGWEIGGREDKGDLYLKYAEEIDGDDEGNTVHYA